MTDNEMIALADRFLAAWTSQDVGAVLACYTDDLVYRDPNTRGAVEGQDAMRRYLVKLFGRWNMTWQRRGAHLFAGGDGCAVLWRATFRRPGSAVTVEIGGMDLVEMRGDRIARNEVYFDRTALAAFEPLV